MTEPASPIPERERDRIRRERPELYRVAFEQGTEPPYTGSLTDATAKGKFSCAVCGAQLFSSDTKFDSGTGWPSFTDALPGATVEREDRSHGMVRTEVVCAKCGAHLGHVFPDGPGRSGCRYCINSVSLTLDPTGH